MIIVNRIPQNEGKGVSGVRGGGGEGRTQEHFFPALRASVWSKNKRGGGPYPRSTTVTCKCINGIPHEDFAVSLQKAMPFT